MCVAPASPEARRESHTQSHGEKGALAYRGHIFPSSGMAHALPTLSDLTAVLASTLGRTGIT